MIVFYQLPRNKLFSIYDVMIIDEVTQIWRFLTPPSSATLKGGILTTSYKASEKSLTLRAGGRL